MLFPSANIIMQHLSDDLFEQKQVSVSVLRLDKIHPVVSGNKLFKLHYFFQDALKNNATGILTFGGAYSNHLLATAYLCRQMHLKSHGIIRGERPALLSPTLQSCIEYGMELTFINRETYRNKEGAAFLENIKSDHKSYAIVPEGGYDPRGAAGAALIMDLIPPAATHICCATGTATTLAGLLMGIKRHQQVVGVPALKNMHDLEDKIKFLTGRSFSQQQLQVMPGYHFGGYAKKTSQLLSFMNSLYQQHQLPTDFVYTGKMMFGILDGIKKGFFPKGSKIIGVHTGGLQGNISLPAGTLVF